MSTFCIVAFDDEKTCSVIPSKWLIDANTCYWPTSKNVSALIENGADPGGANWTYSECRVLMTASKYSFNMT